MPSPYTLILNDVNTLGGEVPTFAAAASRKVRKKVVRFEQDPLPLLLIVPFYEADAAEAFEGKITIDYKVGLAVVFAGNGKFETDLANVIDAKDALRKKLHVAGASCLPTATTVYDSDLDLNPSRALFDLGALDENLDVALMLVTYRSEESRN